MVNWPSASRTTTPRPPFFSAASNVSSPRLMKQAFSICNKGNKASAASSTMAEFFSPPDASTNRSRFQTIRRHLPKGDNGSWTIKAFGLVLSAVADPPSTMKLATVCVVCINRGLSVAAPPPPPPPFFCFRNSAAANAPRATRDSRQTFSSSLSKPNSNVDSIMKNNAFGSEAPAADPLMLTTSSDILFAFLTMISANDSIEYESKEK